MTLTKRTRSAEPDAEDTREAKKNKEASSATQTGVTILVGDEQTQFNVHAEDLIRHSAVLKDELGDFELAYEIKPMIMDNVTEETFDTFITWIYAKTPATDGLVVREMDDDDGSDEHSSVKSSEDGNDRHLTDHVRSDTPATEIERANRVTDPDSDNEPWDAKLNRAGRVFGRLLDASVFAARYDCTTFRRAAMLQLQRCIVNEEALPCPTIVKRALDHLHLEAPLCRYLVLCYGHYTDYHKMSKARLATLPSEFLAAVLDIAFKCVDADGPSTEEDWCKFHEHEDEKERNVNSRARKMTWMR